MRRRLSVGAKRKPANWMLDEAGKSRQGARMAAVTSLLPLGFCRVFGACRLENMLPFEGNQLEFWEISFLANYLLSDLASQQHPRDSLQRPASACAPPACSNMEREREQRKEMSLENSPLVAIYEDRWRFALFALIRLTAGIGSVLLCLGGKMMLA